MSNQIVSASVRVVPCDSRCRYWAKIVRADAALPMPSAVNSANDIASEYLRKGGEDELFIGDIMIEGEENHHRNNRGWSYWITWCGAAGQARRIKNPSSQIKSAMKQAGCDAALLPGAGQVAAAVRAAHGVRLGMVGDDCDEAAVIG